MSFKNNKLLVLSLMSILTLAGCGGGNSSSAAPSTSSGSEPSSSEPAPAKYEREDDDVVYERVLGDFADAYEGATDETNDSKRYVQYAKAEAALLNSGAFVPTTTKGGNYAMTRIAPRTVPYVFFGSDMDKVKTMVMTKGVDSFIKKEDRAALLDLWAKAAAGEAAYDPAAWLVEHGYALGDEYATTTSAAPKSLDLHNTSSQSDTEQIVNCIEGLIQYDNFGRVQPAMASSWEHNADYTEWKFTIREGAKWVTADGTAAGDVTADDFVAGFQHMLDCGAGLEYLLDGVVEGVEEYNYEGGKFENVGVKVEDGKLVFKLVKGESFFLSRLAYSPFSPMKREFFLSKGGAFGKAEYEAAAAEDTYLYGTSMAHFLFNSAFRPVTWDLTDNGGSIVLVKNELYWDAENVTVKKATWNYDDGKNPAAIYEAAIQGTYPGIGLGEGSGLLAKSREDGHFAQFGYTTDTDATTYFGGLNTNRGAYEYNGAAVSTQTEEEKIRTHAAMNNVHFRKALIHGWDRATWNAVAIGEELKNNDLRNMYTLPSLVALEEDVTFEGEDFAQGTSYGDLVQHFADKLGLKVNVADGQDGWFNAEEAKKQIALAREEISTSVWAAGTKVVIDLVYYSGSPTQVAQSAAFEQLIEKELGDYVDVRLVEATTTLVYYYSGYYAASGADLNQDIFYGSGWGPDYNDPSTYLDTFNAGGYMTKVVGIY